ncbi:MAG: hypothetical protein HKL84_03125 [Acidimicrobiaceae bacterium]|nr:hypothetical protein [Acidimicrobiaceae bacterium]
MGEPELLEVGIEMAIGAINMIEPSPMISVTAALDERSSQALGLILERSSAINSESALGKEMAPEFELEIGFDASLVLAKAG